MNLQQLEYIIALDGSRHFQQAAKACFVTQATLSMMIKKLEDELGVVIFDRTRQPVIPTEAGKEIIEQARVILKEASLLKHVSSAAKKEIKGELKLGIIPTLAPYLLPLFVPQLLKKYPLLSLKIKELSTHNIIENLEKEKLDIGILATPLKIRGLKEHPVFYERLRVFVSDKETKLKKKYILPEDIDPDRFWLLEEGHCLRSQTINICELRKENTLHGRLEYEAGSIESLVNFVESNKGITIVPELAVMNFSNQRKKQLRDFKPPVPVREVSLVTYRHFVKNNLINVLQEEIKAAADTFIQVDKLKKQVIEITEK